MLVRELKTLFIHIPKTAGQSVEESLLTELAVPWSERRKRREYLMFHNPEDETLPASMAHLTAKQYLQHGYLTEEEFDSFFKFAFVRNPWDRLVSSYHYLGFDAKCSFAEFVQKRSKNPDKRTYGLHFISQSDFLEDENGEVCVDFVGRFESISADFLTVAEQLNLQSVDLPHRNQGNRRDSDPSLLTGLKYLLKMQRYQFVKFKNTKRHYTDYYDQKTRSVVGKLFEKDIENFGYSFGGD